MVSFTVQGYEEKYNISEHVLINLLSKNLTFHDQSIFQSYISFYQFHTLKMNFILVSTACTLQLLIFLCFVTLNFFPLS